MIDVVATQLSAAEATRGRKGQACGAIDQRLGHGIRDLRLARGMSQQMVADLIGVSAQQLQKYERGINRVSVAALMALAQALQVSPAELLTGLAEREPRAAGLPLRERAALLDGFARIGSPRLRDQVLHLIAEMGLPQAA